MNLIDFPRDFLVKEIFSRIEPKCLKTNVTLKLVCKTFKAILDQLDDFNARSKIVEFNCKQYQVLDKLLRSWQTAV